MDHKKEVTRDNDINRSIENKNLLAKVLQVERKGEIITTNKINTINNKYLLKLSSFTTQPNLSKMLTVGIVDSGAVPRYGPINLQFINKVACNVTL